MSSKRRQTHTHTNKCLYYIHIYRLDGELGARSGEANLLRVIRGARDLQNPGPSFPLCFWPGFLSRAKF